jgi:TPR repeat protein
VADVQDAEDIDPYRHSRQILTTAARVVRLASFNKAECARAETHAGEDPRLATALQDSHYGLTEVLAAAPQLVDRFEHAANPYAKAIMTTAIDYRRLGHHAPLTAELLQTAAVGYLTEQQIATAPPDWFTTAIDYATKLLHGATSSLIPVPGTSMGTIIGYTVADYLLQHGQAARRDTPPPTSIWDAGVNHITDLSVRITLAREAFRRELYQHAELLATPAAESSIPLAMIVLARSLQRVGRVKEAEEWHRRAADTGNPQGMAALADWLEGAGHAEEAEQWYRHAAETGNTDVILILANRLRRAGQAEAEEWYRRAAETDHPHALLTLARWLERARQAEEAEEWYRRAAETGDHDAMVVLARWLGRAGQAEEAEEWYRRAAGTGNLSAMLSLARWLSGHGRKFVGGYSVRQAVGSLRYRPQAQSRASSAVPTG